MHSKLSLSIFLVTLLAVCFYSGTAEAAQAQGIFHDDAHVGKCFISEDFILSPGETKKAPNECKEYHCNGVNGLATVTSCGVVVPPPNCKVGDYVLDAPTLEECCQRPIICEK